MTIKELLDKANEGYPDGFLSEYYDDKGKYVEGAGDTLAQFLVIELTETFDANAPDDVQLVEARRVISTAIDELESTLNSVSNK